MKLTIKGLIEFGFYASRRELATVLGVKLPTVQGWIYRCEREIPDEYVEAVIAGSRRPLTADMLFTRKGRNGNYENCGKHWQMIKHERELTAPRIKSPLLSDYLLAMANVGCERGEYGN